MNLSPKGFRFIATNEGSSLVAYKDGGGVWTIGYGHTHNVHTGMKITQIQGIQFLETDLIAPQSAVNTFVKVKLNQNQFDTLVDFVFNVGVKAFQCSTLLRLLNQGNYKGASAQFDIWVYDEKHQKEPGLVRRRDAETLLFNQK